MADRFQMGEQTFNVGTDGFVRDFVDEIRLYNESPYTQLVEGVIALVTGGTHVA